MNCVYLMTETEKKSPDGRASFGCQIHGQCHTVGPAFPFASCEVCDKSLKLDDPNLSKKFLDPLTIFDKTGVRTHSLRNLLSGGAAFLVCGGPSAKSLPLEKLNQRGIWSLAVNNMAGSVWTNAFVCSDPPSKFHNGIWLDPTVMKFVPNAKMRGYRSHLREKVGSEFRKLEIKVPDCPNVWAFSRRSWLLPDETFFTSNEAAWGNHSAGCLRTGLEKTVNTMFLGIRILYYLGARRIYLVGVDWGMNPDAAPDQNYAFGELRDKSAIESNNSQYLVAGEWLQTLESSGTFKKFGLEIFNCFDRSRLRVFSHVPFDLAIKDALKNFPSQPFDLQDWYKK